MKVARQLRSNDPFDDLGDDSFLSYLILLKIVYLEDRRDDSFLL